MPSESFLEEAIKAARESSEMLIEAVGNARKTVGKESSNGQEIARQVISLLQVAETAMSEAGKAAANAFANKLADELGVNSNDAQEIADALGQGGAQAVAVAIILACALAEYQTTPYTASRVLSELETILQQLLTDKYEANARRNVLTKIGQVSNSFIVTWHHRSGLEAILSAMQRVQQPLFELIQIQRRNEDQTYSTANILERLSHALRNTISALELAVNFPRWPNL